MSTKPTGRLRIRRIGSPDEDRIFRQLSTRSKRERFDAKIVAVISNKRKPPRWNGPVSTDSAALFVDPKPYAGRPDNREAYDRELLDVLRQYEVELVLWQGT